MLPRYPTILPSAVSSTHPIGNLTLISRKVGFSVQRCFHARESSASRPNLVARAATCEWSSKRTSRNFGGFEDLSAERDLTCGSAFISGEFCGIQTLG